MGNYPILNSFKWSQEAVPKHRRFICHQHELEFGHKHNRFQLTVPNDDSTYFWWLELLLILDRLEIFSVLLRPPFVTCSSYKVSISLKRSCTDPLEVYSKTSLKFKSLYFRHHMIQYQEYLRFWVFPLVVLYIHF